MRELATIVIPVFGANRHPLELALLQQARRVLPDFTFVFVGPDTLEKSRIHDGFPGSTVYRFDSKLFEDRNGYATLLLQEDFYDIFGWSEYILLFEPLSYVVKDELRYWCKQGHDYVSDKAGSFSLRNVDRFRSVTKNNKREISKFLSEGPSRENDRGYWQKKARGIWPALRNPTPIVSDYFSQPVNQRLTSLETSRLPFALTGFDICSEEHQDYLTALQN